DLGQVAHSGRNPPAVDAEAGRTLAERDLGRREIADRLADELDDLVEQPGRVPPDDGFLLRVDIFRRAHPWLSGHGRTAVRVRGVQQETLARNTVLRPDRIRDRVR